MRASKTLLILTILVASFAFGSSSASAAAPSVDVIEASGGQTELSFSGQVNPNGLATLAHFDYFPIGDTSNCNEPSILDLLNIASTEDIPLDPVTTTEPVSAFAVGLPNETEYCYRLVASNLDGASETLFWFAAETSAPLPTLANVAFDGGTDSISYTADLTPNTGEHTVILVAEYFEKPEGTCDEYPGGPQEAFNDNPENGWNGWTGYSTQAVAGTVSGLQPNTTYCIRLRALGYHGDSNTTNDWTTITTVQPEAVSIDNVRMQASPTPGVDAALKFDLDDHGAADDAGTPSKYNIYVFDVGAGRCNSDDYFGGDQLVDENNIDFSGEAPVSFDMDDLELGKPYCATIVGESAWGDDYDTTVHVEVTFGTYPTIDDQTTYAIDHTAIGVSIMINPGHLATKFGIEYFPKGLDSCNSDGSTPRIRVHMNTITTLLSTPQLRNMGASSLDPDTAYCARGWVENSWGEEDAAFEEITTEEQPPQAEIGGVLPMPTTTSGMSAALRYHVNDMGAHADTGNPNNLSVKVWAATQEECDNPDIADETPLSTGNQNFAGDATVDIDVSGMTAGNGYCVRAFVDSAWVGSDNVRWDYFVLPTYPVFEAISVTKTSSSATFESSLAATWIDTDYELQWHTHSGSGACADEDSNVAGAGTTTGSQPNSAKALSTTVTGLAIDDVICARYAGDNRFGVQATEWTKVEITDIDPPSKPTGLTFSNVTQTSATLSWTASTDNDLVDFYIVKFGAAAIANPTSPTTTVSLTCGETKSFKVIAVDVAGNVSESSDSASVTAAACSVTQPPATDPPAPRLCFKALTKKFSGKSKAGKKFSIVVAGTPSADGQSIKFSLKLSGAGKAAAKAGFAKIKKGKFTKTAVRTDGTPVFFRFVNGAKVKETRLIVNRALC